MQPREYTPYPQLVVTGVGGGGKVKRAAFGVDGAYAIRDKAAVYRGKLGHFVIGMVSGGGSRGQGKAIAGPAPRPHVQCGLTAIHGSFPPGKQIGETQGRDALREPAGKQLG